MKCFQRLLRPSLPTACRTKVSWSVQIEALAGVGGVRERRRIPGLRRMYRRTTQVWVVGICVCKSASTFDSRQIQCKRAERVPPIFGPSAIAIEVSGHIQTMIPGRRIGTCNLQVFLDGGLHLHRYACFECAPPAVVAGGGDENAIKREADMQCDTQTPCLGQTQRLKGRSTQRYRERFPLYAGPSFYAMSMLSSCERLLKSTRARMTSFQCMI